MSTFTETVQRALGKKEERRYSVGGDIVFEFTPAPGRECFPEVLAELRVALKSVNRAYPWKDRNDYDGTDAPSFSHLSDGQSTYHNFSTPELHVWFHIIPGIDNVRKSQIYAYEKYLEKLAEELSKKELGAMSVRSVFRVGSGTTFKT